MFSSSLPRALSPTSDRYVCGQVECTRATWSAQSTGCFFPVHALTLCTCVGVPHRVQADDVYRGCHIPEGAMIIPNIWYVPRHACAHASFADVLCSGG